LAVSDTGLFDSIACFTANSLNPAV